jgi:hypothetical protein
MKPLQTHGISTSVNRGMVRSDRYVDEPASDELSRAEYLADYFAKQLALAERFKASKVSLNLDESRELVQLLHDSIRTAKQLRG